MRTDGLHRSRNQANAMEVRGTGKRAGIYKGFRIILSNT
jgi:hypothetical protein